MASLKRKRKSKLLLMTKRDSKAEKITAAGGILFRKEPHAVQILLIHRNGVWDLPKGKLEPGESIAECAAREVREEVGLKKNPVIEANLGTTEHSYEQNGTHYDKVTYWFVMRLTEDQLSYTPQEEEGIDKVEWISVEKAGEIVEYLNLKHLIARFKEGIYR